MSKVVKVNEAERILQGKRDCEKRARKAVDDEAARARVAQRHKDVADITRMTPEILEELKHQGFPDMVGVYVWKRPSKGIFRGKPKPTEVAGWKIGTRSYNFKDSAQQADYYLLSDGMFSLGVGGPPLPLGDAMLDHYLAEVAICIRLFHSRLIES